MRKRWSRRWRRNSPATAAACCNGDGAFAGSSRRRMGLGAAGVRRARRAGTGRQRRLHRRSGRVVPARQGSSTTRSNASPCRGSVDGLLGTHPRIGNGRMALSIEDFSPASEEHQRAFVPAWQRSRNCAAKSCSASARRCACPSSGAAADQLRAQQADQRRLPAGDRRQPRQADGHRRARTSAAT